MKKIGNFVCKFKWVILVVSFLLLIPSCIGMYKTKINYDILVYLPEDIETLKGQHLLTDEFNMGAFSITVVDNMKDKDLLQLENEIKNIEGVNKVLSIADITGTTIPIDFLPSDIVRKVTNGNSKLMLITFNESTSDENTLLAVEKIRELTKDKCKVGGMSAMVLDTKELFNSEMALYVFIAVILCVCVLMVSLDSYLVPILLILNIGIAILYNMGTNIFFGDISYITKAISSVLQLGVTTDFSIFLYHKYEKAKKENKDKDKAMANAIYETLVSVFGSSLTTIAGFLALCTMNLTLGKDIGLVMAKGVLFGLLCVITLFPSLLLVFDKGIEKTKHKEILPKFNGVKKFVMKHYKLIFVIFIVLLFPFYKAQSKTPVYYNLDKSIPENYGYTIASKDLKENFNIVSQEIILIDAKMSDSSINSMIEEIKKLEGIDFVLSPSYLTNYGISDEILDANIKSMYQSKNYKMILINSSYDIATDKLNNQIVKIKEIVSKYSKKAIVAGEGPLMKDLVEITDEDFRNVNGTSILVIFVLMMIVLKSISLPILLVAAIEFAIFINMGIPYFTNESIPFIASVVIGTIQLGATIDYAILLTTTYLEKRKNKVDKKTAVKEALDSSISSIFVSGMCFFAATIGVGIVSKIDMIGSLCTLIARGAIISMIVVVMIVPSLLMIFDTCICKTTLGFKKIKKESDDKMKKKKRVNVKKVTACFLVLLLSFSTMPVYALTKEETVYAKLKPNGNINYTTVTEHLINDTKEEKIKDKTNLTNIINTNGEETFKKEEDTILWEANKKDIYYKGTTEKELPISLDISYKLDGKEIDVENLLGKSGKIEIKLNFKNKDKHIVNVNGQNKTMYTPFVVALTTAFDTKKTSDLKVTNGKVVTNGNTLLVTAIASPGIAKSLNANSLENLDHITISYETTNFELNSMYFAATAKVIDNADLKAFDKLDVLYDKINTLSENSTKLVEGSTSITNGAKQIKEGVLKAINELKNNQDTLDATTLKYIENQAVENALQKVEASKEEIMNNAKNQVVEKENQTHAIKNASDLSVSSNAVLISSLKLKAKEIFDATDAGQACLADSTSPYCSVLSGVEEQVIQQAKEEFYKNALELAKQTAAESAYASAYQTAKQTASEVSITLAVQLTQTIKNEIMDKVALSLNTLVQGLDQLVNGAQTVSDKMAKFDKEGIQTIENFVNTKVKSSSKDIKALTTLANNYDTFTKKEKNTSGNTKFVFVVDGIKQEEKKKTNNEAEKEETTFFKRLTNLFK